MGIGEDPPSFTLNALSNAIDINGTPGATSTIGLRLTDITNFDDDVRLIIGNDADPAIDGDDIPDAIEGGVDFSFGTTTLNASDNDTDLTLEVTDPIRTDQTVDIYVTAIDTAGNVTHSTDSFTLNADGFSPRTIEEF